MTKSKFIILFFMALNLSAIDLESLANKETAICELKSNLSAINNLIGSIGLDIDRNSDDVEYCQEQKLALEGLESKVSFLKTEISDKELELSNFKETLNVLKKINFMKDLHNRLSEFITNNPHKDKKEFLNSLPKEELLPMIELENFFKSQAK